MNELCYEMDAKRIQFLMVLHGQRESILKDQDHRLLNSQRQLII
jgi:hypothetical protein